MTNYGFVGAPRNEKRQEWKRKRAQRERGGMTVKGMQKRVDAMVAQGMTHAAIYDAFLANGIVLESRQFDDTRPALIRIADTEATP